jgi:hypothetical protein
MGELQAAKFQSTRVEEAFSIETDEQILPVPIGIGVA